MFILFPRVLLSWLPAAGVAMRDWYCAQTKPNEERRALAHIMEAGLRAWLPELRVAKRRHGRPVTSLEPLFRGYLFVAMDPGSPGDWRAVRWARGVRSIVGDGAGPFSMPTSVMAALMARFGHEAADDPFFLAPGARVRVTRGPMAYLEGLVLAGPTPQHRVQVLMHLLRREVTIELDGFDLERVS